MFSGLFAPFFAQLYPRVGPGSASAAACFERRRHRCGKLIDAEHDDDHDDGQRSTDA